MKRIALMIGLLALGGALAAPVTLLEKGDFSVAPHGRFESTPEGKALVITDGKGGCGWTFKLDPKWAVVNLKGDLRVTDVPQGKLGWQNARFAMEWTDANGKTVGPWPRNEGLNGTTEWRAFDYNNTIPTNAVNLKLALCNFAGGGEARFRNVSLTVLRDRMEKPGNAPLPADAPADAEALPEARKIVTATRVRYPLDGYWRIRPALAGEAAGTVPEANDNWAWDRIPRAWPDGEPFCASRNLSPWYEDHPSDTKRFERDRAWYARRFTMPKSAAGKRVLLTFDMIASRATVYLDGHPLSAGASARGPHPGTVEFPNGSVDLTPFIRPGETQTLALDVTAYPQGETLNYNEATRANKEKKTVKFKGITGDLWLDIVPPANRVLDAYAETSVTKGEITFCTELEQPIAEGRIEAEVTGCGETHRFAGKAVRGTDGLLRFTAPWRDAKLWDVPTPQNIYTCRLTVRDTNGQTIDAAVPFTFGFREVKLAGRDILLNGAPIHLRALFDVSNTRAGSAGEKTNALVTCRAAQANGFNFFIAGNYAFNAGSVTGVEGLLSACDETGMLYSFTLPHFKDFAPLDKPEMQAAYRRVTRQLMRLARNHPSVITYATSHNAAGYLGAGHPQRIDGTYELPASVNGANRKFARIARTIIGELDATRPAYHHESGNLDDFHTVNCYLNWSPIQERSEWLEHWATEGVKPLFFVEWGMPHVSSWSSYRGPLFIWRCTGYMSLWSAEYAAAFRDDKAYEMTDAMRRALKQEESLWSRGRPFRWTELNGYCGAITDNYQGIQALMMSDNWRSFRGWGISATLPWDLESRHMSAAEPKSPVGKMLRRWNMDDCAWIAGDGKFTDKRHLFRPGEEVRKTLMILNDRRVTQSVSWKVETEGFTKEGTVKVSAGGQARVPIAFAAAKAGDHTIRATFRFADGVEQTDEFTYTTLDPAPQPKVKVALYDPKGLTTAEFKRLGIAFEPVADLASFDLSKKGPNIGKTLVIGRESLEPSDLRARLVPFAAASGRTIVFEQTKETLEAIGFRVQTYGLRNAWPRYRKEALGVSQQVETLRDWAGESTLVPGYTPLKEIETSADTDTWAGYRHTRVWRNGNRGAVATVLPEKPSYGDWCALADGAFDLQYAPLLEWRIGDGAITFCQFDVTGRTMNDPAADDLVRRLVAGSRERLPDRFIALARGTQAQMNADVRGPWIVEPDENKPMPSRFFITGGAAGLPDDFHERIRNGGVALCCGLSAAEVAKVSPVPLACEERKGVGYSRIAKLPPELNGLSNGDWAWHGFLDFAAFTDPAEDGNEAIRVVRYGKGKLVFWQVPPWKIDAEARPYLRTSKRRAEAMLSRLMGNLGFNRPAPVNFYADVPIPADDPYQYFHW